MPQGMRGKPKRPPAPGAAPAPLARIVAERAEGIRFEDIPAEVVEAAKDQLLDQLGVGLVAATLARNRCLGDALARLGAGGRCTGLGMPGPLPAASAALRNGALMHSLEYDATHVAAIVHAGSVAAPAALAMAEQEGAPGPALLRAFILGWELFIRLGLAAPGAFQGRGFQLTAVGGPFAGALIGGLLGGLSVPGLANALGIAGSQASGLFEFVAEGATVKALHAGWAAHAGIVAAELARAGMTGPATIFEGRYGFYRAYTDASDAPARLRGLVATLGTRWHVPEVALKEHPCCHYIQPFLECLESLLDAGLGPDEVAAIHCEVPRGEEFLICEPWERKLAPGSAYEAKFSLAYALGARLVDGRVGVETFEGEAREDVCRAARKVTYSTIDAGFPERYAARLRVTTAAGRAETAEVADVRGGARRPFPRATVHAKFRDNARRALAAGAVERVAALVLGLEREADLSGLSSALRDLR